MYSSFRVKADTLLQHVVLSLSLLIVTVDKGKMAPKKIPPQKKELKGCQGAEQRGYAGNKNFNDNEFQCSTLSIMRNLKYLENPSRAAHRCIKTIHQKSL